MMQLESALRRLAVLSPLVVAAACGSSPTTPTPPPPPPVVINTPPVIDDFGLSVQRIEAGATLQANATLHDAETPLDQIKYVWTATPVNGTFTGSGPNATWQAPVGEKTPDVYTLKLTLTENYTSAGLPQQNVTSRSGDVRYNDSRKEIAALSNQFFTWFTTYEVSPEQAVSQFSDSCPGKLDELADIRKNRRDFHILDGHWDQLPNITFDSAMLNASATLSCTFNDIPNGGVRESVRGVCRLTAIYQNWQWYLCESHFDFLGASPYSNGSRSMGYSLQP